MNVDLAAGADAFKNIHILDTDHLFAQVGLQECEDARGARVAGAPLSVAALRALAAAQVRHIRAISGPAKKCVVVDCDNTLWGGVVGEDGIARLILGESGAGRKHRNLQQDLLNLRRRGAVLAICSKNEAADVLEVLRSHPDMLLREEDFAAMRINWRDKAENVVSIAEELNLGLEHIVLLDDNPAECEWVRTQLPEVHVIEWPRDLEGSHTLDDLGLFDTLGLTAEDRGRTETYRAETKRRAARQKSGSVADYLRSLNMVATVGQAGPEHLSRVGQLILRTNQFNLTTRRHDMTELESLMRAPDAAVVWLDLCDRFGASGIVGCGILRNQGDDALIDTLLLSCRVIGRGAEAVLVHVLAKLGRDRGAATITGEYVPSKRNALVVNFYRDLGFEGPEKSGEGLLWHWTLSRGLPPFPESLEVIYEDLKDER
jgi:FkbH-like protein